MKLEDGSFAPYLFEVSNGFNPDIGMGPNYQEVIPRRIHEARRICCLMHAISKKLKEGLNIPVEWDDELQDLLWTKTDAWAESNKGEDISSAIGKDPRVRINGNDLSIAFRRSTTTTSPQGGGAKV